MRGQAADLLAEQANAAGRGHETGELTERPQKRYDDTDLILSTICESGYDSREGRAALRRMTRIHDESLQPFSWIQ